MSEVAGKSESSELLTPEQAAKLLHTSWPVLAMWRSRRSKNLPFVKLGRRVYYRPADIQRYIESCVDPGVGPRDYHPRSGVRKARATKRGAR